MSGEARYSQPRPERPRDGGAPVVRAGFVGKGANKQPGFIFLNENGKVERQELTAENRAQERPRGFFQSLARLFHGGPFR